ncbi:MAG: hypothetical protein KDC90_11435, partial [Ignavibacteriae bacterium]|nr:hypothetical protein [Ignavibacteriota bacterium]
MNKAKQTKFFVLMLFLISSFTIFAQPTITQQPVNQSVTEGSQATFSVTATSAVPITYQWIKGVTPIAGATNNSYTTPPTVLGDDGSVFHCAVTDTGGTTLSSSATLTVSAGIAPIITVQPTDKYILTGQTATFSVTATGTAPLSYQWKKNNINITGATSASYTTPAAILADNGTVFTCLVKNNFDSVTSVGATLGVADAGSRITSGLQVLYEFEDQSGDVIHDVSGTASPEDLAILTPEKTAWTTYGLEAFDLATARRSVTNSKITQNCNASNEITLEVWIQPEWVNQNSGRVLTFAISDQDGNFTIYPEGDHYQFVMHTTATNGNGEPGISSSAGTQKLELTHLVYTKNNSGSAKVYVNGVLDATGTIAGAIEFSPQYFLGIASAPFGGAHWRGMYYLAAVYDRALSEFEVQHNYSIGTPVDEKPVYTIHPKDKYIIEGESLLLDSYAVSVLPINYQWRKNGVFIEGQTSRFLNLSNLTLADDGAIFTSTASSEGGHTISNEAILHVTSIEGRVTSNIQALYTFKEGTGNKVNDVSGVGTPLDLTIYSTAAVAWDAQGLKINQTPSIITTNSATKITNPVKATNEITIEAWVKSANTAQTSPSRIFTVSADGSNRNFSLGQNNSAYEVNLRTTTTGDNGTPAIGSSPGTVSATGFDHIMFTRAANGTAKFYINGTERVSTTVGGDFFYFNSVYLLSLGNEFGVDQHWLGLVNLIAIYDRALSNSEVLKNFNFGAYGVVYRPTNVTLESNEIGKISFGWSDNSENEEGFIVERGVGTPLIFTQIGSLGADSTTFADTNIVDNTIYSYRVKGFYTLGESNYSDTLVVKSLIKPIEAPSNLEYTLNAEGYPVLTWSDNSDNEAGFKIERRIAKAGSSFALIDSVDADVTSFTDLLVADSTSYVYKIYAFNS